MDPTSFYLPYLRDVLGVSQIILAEAESAADAHKPSSDWILEGDPTAAVMFFLDHLPVGDERELLQRMARAIKLEAFLLIWPAVSWPEGAVRPPGPLPRSVSVNYLVAFGCQPPASVTSGRQLWLAPALSDMLSGSSASIQMAKQQAWSCLQELMRAMLTARSPVA